MAHIAEFHRQVASKLKSVDGDYEEDLMDAAADACVALISRPDFPGVSTPEYVLPPLLPTDLTPGRSSLCFLDMDIPHSDGSSATFAMTVGRVGRGTPLHAFSIDAWAAVAVLSGRLLVVRQLIRPRASIVEST